MRRIVGVCVVLLAVALPSQGSAWRPGRGRPAAVHDWAVGLCVRPRGVPRTLLRTAIIRVSERGSCGATRGLAHIVANEERDTLTRSMAALAIGEIDCQWTWRGRREGIHARSAEVLIAATEVGEPAAVRQSAVRALGRSSVEGAIDTLVAFRDSDPDPVVQFLSAQALTRITGQDYFDESYRDDLVLRYVAVASNYELLEMTP